MKFYWVIILLIFPALLKGEDEHYTSYSLNELITGPFPVKDEAFTSLNNLKRSLMENPDDVREQTDTLEKLMQKKRNTFFFFLVFSLIAALAFIFRNKIIINFRKFFEKKPPPKDPKKTLTIEMKKIKESDLSLTEKTLSLEKLFSRYLDEVYHLNIRLKTSQEFIKDFISFSPTSRENITQFFLSLEKVKFAGVQVENSNYQQLLSNIDQFLKNE